MYLDISRKKVIEAGSAGHHALLIEGNIGCGRYTTAKLTACAMLKCGKDDLILKGIHPDVITVEEEKGKISVEKMREIKSDAAILPNEADRKVYIIRDAQNMTIQAQNAFLKVLEEPPKHVVFILTVDNRAKLLETILSRVAVFGINNFSVSECARILREKFGEAEGIEETAELFEGNVGLAEEALKDGKIIEDVKLGLELINSAYLPYGWETMRILSAYEKDKDRFKSFLDMLKIQCVKIAADRTIGRENEMRKIRKEVKAEELLKIAEISEDTKKHIEMNGYFPLVITMFCAKIRKVKG